MQPAVYIYMYRFNGYDGRLKQEALTWLASPSRSPSPNPKPDQVRRPAEQDARDDLPHHGGGW